MDKNPDLTNKYLGRLSKRATLSAYRIARELRLTPTEAEETLWALLRNRQLNGKKFRRQHPMGDYVFDFYCHEAKLAIELDESDSEMEAANGNKSETGPANKPGITLIRFWSDDVIKHPEKVLKEIAKHFR